MTQIRCPMGCTTRCQPNQLCWFNGCRDVEALRDRLIISLSDDIIAMFNEKGRPDLAANFATKIRDIDLGISHARATWSALSSIQRRVLGEAARHGGRLERVGKEYRHGARNQPYRAVYVATIRNLCSRELMAWDGGAFDPEAAVVLTERGRFVLRHGPSDA